MSRTDPYDKPYEALPRHIKRDYAKHGFTKADHEAWLRRIGSSYAPSDLPLAPSRAEDEISQATNQAAVRQSVLGRNETTHLTSRHAIIKIAQAKTLDGQIKVGAWLVVFWTAATAAVTIWVLGGWGVILVAVIVFLCARNLWISTEPYKTDFDRREAFGRREARFWKTMGLCLFAATIASIVIGLTKLLF